MLLTSHRMPQPVRWLDGGQELPLGDGRVLELQIRRRILDQDSALEIRLRPIHVAAEQSERFLGHRQRQQVGQVVPVGIVPGQMLGHQAGLEALHGDADAFKVRGVESLGAAKRKTDAVQRQRIVAANGVEVGERLAATHIVLGMDFEPRHLGARVDDDLVVLKAQPDPRRSGDRAALSPRQGRIGRE